MSLRKSKLLSLKDQLAQEELELELEREQHKVKRSKKSKEDD